MIVDNHLVSPLTPEQLRGTAIDDAPDRNATPTSTLDATHPVQKDGVTVTVSFVQYALVQTAIEVIGRRLESTGDSALTAPISDTSPADTTPAEVDAAPVVEDSHHDEDSDDETTDVGLTRPVSKLAEKVASRVLHRIGKRLDHALKKLAKLERRPNDDIKHVQKRLAQAIRDLTKAVTIALRGTFGQLRDIGVDGENSDQLLDEIRDHVLSGVGQLSGEFDGRIRAGSLDGIEAFAEASVSRERTFSLEVRTQEGDTVTIQIESRTSSSATVDFSRSDTGFSFSASSETFSEQSLSFRVEGDLNEQETAAIQALVASAEQLSNQFYGGDLEAAFSAAQELQFDSSEISGFELELRQTVQARVAATYREVAALGDVSEPADAVIPTTVTPATVAAPERELAEGGLSTNVALAPTIDQGTTVQPSSTLAGFESLIPELTTRFDLSSLFDDAFGLVRQLLAGALQIHPAAGDGEA